jgi:ABC-2 type transport system permease protein
VRFAGISSKAWKERIRNRNILAMQLLFPAVFMLVFGLAFSGGGFGKSAPYEILLINEDTGTGDQNFGDELVRLISEITYENSTTKRFLLNNGTKEQSTSLLQDREITAAMVIPPDFSEAIQAMINATIRGTLISLKGEGYIPPDQNLVLPQVTDIEVAVIVQGDPGYQGFGAAQSMLQALMTGFIDSIREEARNQATSQVPGTPMPPPGVGYQTVTLELESILGTSEFSAFDYYAPGIIIFGLLLGIPAVAEALSREVDTKTLSRLKISMMSSFDLLFGSLLPWALFAVLQVLILFFVALGLGYDWVGGFMSLGLALLVGSIVGVAGIATGMLIAAFARDQEHASSLGTLFAVPVSFLVGVFFDFPAGIMTKITAVLPWRQGLLSLLGILSFGEPIEEVMPNILAMVIETAVIFIIGVVAFSRLKLRAE